MIRVLIADDHALLRAGLRARLQAEPDIAVVGEAATAPTAVTRSRDLQADVVLLDLMLPGTSGWEILPTLARRSPAVRVLIVSAQASPGSVRRAIRAGASGYLCKRASDHELTSAIRRVAGNETYIDPGLGACLVVGSTSGPTDALSDRERDVLDLLTLGYTNLEIGRRLHISVRTVDTHRAHIMGKLGLQTRAELVMFALANGIVGP
jgi:DNA-binding NarL/FixJ family response regulator